MTGSNAFIETLHERGIGLFAYFNVTEYGGSGGREGDAEAGGRALEERFADALVKNERGEPIRTWEGARVMNPGRDLALRPELVEQVERHLTRLPGMDGFCIDRLDWASRIDHGHHDGLTMIGDRPVENMALPVGDAVREVCRLSHAAGKRVYVNQFYRPEVLRDVDGVCHENDYLPALGYLITHRPAAAWHLREGYADDLLAFEAQMKRRLHWALFPQMIAHAFPISQQPPDPEAADLLELYAPLFAAFHGKEQVLLPHCVIVDGANEANLFLNGAGRYVVPVTSRVAFLSRGNRAMRPVTVKLAVPDGSELTWAHALRVDGPPVEARLRHDGETLRITVPGHGTASVIVAGKGDEPSLGRETPHGIASHHETYPIDPLLSPARERALAEIRDRRFPSRGGARDRIADWARIPEAVETCLLVVTGTHVGHEEALRVLLNGREIGRLENGRSVYAFLPSILKDDRIRVGLYGSDEGTWFVPNKVDLLVRTASGRIFRVARWSPPDDAGLDGLASRLWLEPVPQAPEETVMGEARFLCRDRDTRGAWPGRYGDRAYWIPGVAGHPGTGEAYRLEVVTGRTYTWAREAAGDERVLAHSEKSDSPPAATCWFHEDALRFRITPPGDEAYRLTLYLLDHDRDGRAMEVAVAGETSVRFSRQWVSAKESEAGIFLTWTLKGPAFFEVCKRTGTNAVVSGIFIDPEP